MLCYARQNYALSWKLLELVHGEDFLTLEISLWVWYDKCLIVLWYICRACSNLFYGGGGWVKMLVTMVGQRQKMRKKKQTG